MQITANTDTKWDKDEIPKYTIYKKLLKFGEIRYFESGKALFSGQLGLSKKQKDGTYIYSNLELQVWGDDAESLANALNSQEFSVSIIGGSIEGAGYVGKNGEVKKIALVNPQQIIIHSDDQKAVDRVNKLQEMPF